MTCTYVIGLSGLSILENCLFHVLPFKPDDKLKLVDAFAECRAKSRTSSDLSSFDTLVATCASEHVKFTKTVGLLELIIFHLAAQSTMHFSKHGS